MRTPGRLQDSIEKIKNNSHTSVWVEGEPPKRLNLYYLDDDLLRAPSLRQDYQFPYLHKFLRLQKTSLSIWPQEAPHLRPRQSKEEQFMCLTSGELEVKLLSPIFSQNMYQGVYEDLPPHEVPEDIDMWELNAKYQLLKDVEHYILTTEVK